MPRDALEILLEQGYINELTKQGIILHAGGSNGLGLMLSRIRFEAPVNVRPFQPEEYEEIAAVLEGAGETNLANRVHQHAVELYENQQAQAYRIRSSMPEGRHGAPLVGIDLQNVNALAWIIQIGLPAVARALRQAKEDE